MFRAFLCPSSGALEYMCVFAAYCVPCLAVCCRGSGAGQQGVRPGRGMLYNISAIKHTVTSSWFFFSFFSTHMQRCTDKHTSSLQAKSLQLRCISSIRGVLTVRNDHHCSCADVVTMKICEFWYTLMLCETYEYFSEIFVHLY